MEFKRLSDVYDKACGKGGTVSTGLKSLDEILGGFELGRLYAIGGRPDMGTTSLMLQMALNIACDAENPKPAYIFTMGETCEKLAERLSAYVFSENVKGVRDKKEDTDLIAQNRKALSDIPIYICNGWGYTTEELCRFCMGLEDGIVFVDYLEQLQLCRMPYMDDRGQALIEELNYRSLSHTAECSGIPIVVLTHLHEEINDRFDRRPELYDFCNPDTLNYITGAISLYRELRYHGAGNDDTAELTVLMNSGHNGTVGTAKCRWDYNRQLFIDKD